MSPEHLQLDTTRHTPRSNEPRRDRDPMPRRALLILASLLIIGAAHWLVPVDPGPLQLLHVLMRKMFILPVVLGAIWFQMRGALVAAICMTAIYMPHVLFQWAGHPQENASQFGDLLVAWTVAVLAGWLVARERHALQELSHSHEGAVHALVAALDAREHGTEMHSIRVRAYARRILEQMNPTQGDLAALETGALLHDVGKIGVPDQILLKAGSLDESEWEVMRRHPKIGRDILCSTSLNPKSIEIVWFHHERYDGNGYPFGLQGTEIPPLVRVFSIADAFDAITSVRPYKVAQSVQVGRDLIEEGSGSHFDPQFVEAFLSVPADEWTQIAQRFDAESAADDEAENGRAC